MNWELVNLPAVLAAAISTFLVGGLWYSPLLFAQAWMRENGFSETDLRRHSKGRAFGGSAVFALIMAFNLALFLADEKTDLAWGVAAGALAGVGWVATGLGTVALFENRTWTYIAINSGYQIVSFLVMGAILGAWR